MQTHTQSSILIHAPITFVWRQLWQNFLQSNTLTTCTNITKFSSLEILRTVTIDQKAPRKEKLTKNEKYKQIKNLIVDDNIFGEITYEIEQTPKGEVLLRMKSNVIDQSKKTYPGKAGLDCQLAVHKELIEHKHKNPKKKGVCC